MKSFLLHDGEDDNKTTELHAFLAPLIKDTPHDFEGGNHGINITLVVHAGDTIVMRNDDSVRIYEKVKPVFITRFSFPMTHMAFLMVEMDNGAHHHNRIAATLGQPEQVNLERFEMPYAYGVEKLVRCENALYQLMRSSHVAAFQLFVTGEQSEQEDLVNRVKDTMPDLAVAHALLNDWFNAWEVA